MLHAYQAYALPLNYTLGIAPNFSKFSVIYLRENKVCFIFLNQVGQYCFNPKALIVEISGNLDKQIAEVLTCKYVLNNCSEPRFVLQAVTETDAPKVCVLSF